MRGDVTWLWLGDPNLFETKFLCIFGAHVRQVIAIWRKDPFVPISKKFFFFFFVSKLDVCGVFTSHLTKNRFREDWWWWWQWWWVVLNDLAFSFASIWHCYPEPQGWPWRLPACLALATCCGWWADASGPVKETAKPQNCLMTTELTTLNRSLAKSCQSCRSAGSSFLVSTTGNPRDPKDIFLWHVKPKSRLET